MSFPESVAAEALASCGRCCCICHKFCGTKIELHHIKQKAYGGKDTLDNCIPLCFDCHSDMGKADPNHPKGKKYSEDELKRHRDNWYKKISSSLICTDEATVYHEDIALFQKICDLFTPEVKIWISENDIGGSHPYHIFDNIAKFLHDCNDPFFEFINPELEKMRGNLIYSMKRFMKYKNLNTFVKTVGAQDLCVTREWMVNHEGWEPRSLNYDEYSTQYAAEANALNDLATNVWSAYCEFARQGRRLLAQPQIFSVDRK